MKRTLLSLVSTLTRLLPSGFKRGLYRLGPVSKLIRTLLNRISPTGLTTVRVSAGALAGMQLRLDLQTEKDYWLGTYEVDLQQAVAEHVRPGWVAYDVGANIGYISLLLARAVGESGRVQAFEALPANLERLRENIELNALTERVTVIAGAVTDSSRPVRFLIGPSGAMGKVAGSAGREDIHLHSIQVPGIALDDFVYQQGNPAPQVLKMDIEGGEVLAIKAMSRLLREARPLVFLEVHGPEAARAAWDTFPGAGYRVCRMEPGLPPVSSLAELDWKAYLVAVP
ncbi:MAG: FkbM family methyltransferase [Anaerolineales bacterium]|nr:FkbM family methyltransferase [Anaerolineales bacterium]